MDCRTIGSGGYVALLLLALNCAVPGVSRAEEANSGETLVMVQVQTEPKRQLIMAANLKLTEAEGAKFWPVYREYRDDVARINEKALAVIKDFADNYASLTDTKAKSITRGMLETKKQRIALMSKYVPKYAKVLGDVKTARAMQIESKLDALVDVALAQTIPLVQP